jgi:60 kDa SS-A/Ro ribonucleoprotein
MTDTLRSMSTRQHPQTERADARQERNAAGGYTFVVDDVTRLRRFLATGVEGGTFYVGSKDVATESVACIERLIADGRGVDAVSTILDMSERGATMRQQSTMFALAYLSGATDEATRTAALRALPRVCRTASHLMLFASYVEQFRGWGRALRRAVGQWYLDKPLDKVAYQGAKFRSRYGFTHRDLLRLSHPKPRRAALALDVALTNLAESHVGDYDKATRARHEEVCFALTRVQVAAQDGRFDDAIRHLDQDALVAFDDESIRAALADDISRSALLALLAKRPDVDLGSLPQTSIVAETLAATSTPAETVEVLGEVESASWEMVQSEHLGKPEVWRALLDHGHVPVGALIRNLGRLTANGTLDPIGVDDRTMRVVARLRDQRVLTEGRVHPMSVMLAGATYATGHGDKGSLTWSPISNINKALDAGFYAAFGSIEPDDSKTVMLALDVSGSMDGQVAGLPLTARTAGVGLAQCLAAQFPRNLGVVFTGEGWRNNGWGRGITEGTNVLLPHDFDPNRRLTDVVRETSEYDFGRTDCSLPMLHALERGLAIDTFVVITDNETWAGGKMHPHEALRLYRERTGIDARMVTVAVQHNRDTIADPADPRMLDVVGLDPNVISLVGDFVAGRV